MTGTPDTEAARALFREWLAQPPTERNALPPYELFVEAAFIAGFAAAEGPWREHIAAEVIAMGSERHQHHGLAYSVAKKVAARIVRGSETADEFQDSED